MYKLALLASILLCSNVTFACYPSFRHGWPLPLSIAESESTDIGFGNGKSLQMRPLLQSQSFGVKQITKVHMPWLIGEERLLTIAMISKHVQLFR